jgi:hypothetical protein
LARGNAARAGRRRSLSGGSAFTYWVRLKIPLTPYDFAQGRLRLALRANGILNRATAVLGGWLLFQVAAPKAIS